MSEVVFFILAFLIPFLIFAWAIGSALKEEGEAIRSDPPGPLSRMGEYLLRVQDPDEGIRVDPGWAVRTADDLLARIQAQHAVRALDDSGEWSRALDEAAQATELLARAVHAGVLPEQEAQARLGAMAELLDLGPSWGGIQELLKTAWGRIHHRRWERHARDAS